MEPTPPTRGRARDSKVSADSPPAPDDASQQACPFCASETVAQAVAVWGSVFALEDKYPVAPGHLLVLPRRHTPDFFTMTTRERHDAAALLVALRQRVLHADPSVLGFNVGANCGEVAGQTVTHAHIHLIPRRQGDTPHPRGGVRGVIPAKMSY